MNDTEELEIEEYRLLKTQDIARNLGIAESTVRKYCQNLAEKGYDFRRDETGARVYTDHDQVSLLELMKLRKEGKVGLDVAAEIVATRRKSQNESKNINNASVLPTQSVHSLVNQGSSEFQQDISLQNITEFMHNIRHIKDNLVSKDQLNYLVQSVEKVLDSNSVLLRQLNESEIKKEDAKKEKCGFKRKTGYSC